MSKKLSARLFNAKKPTRAAAAELRALLTALAVPFERLGWDDYDGSVEIHGVPPDYKLSDEARKALAAEDFDKVYVNHTDSWETHYGLSDVSVPGWRVSYPEKRRDGTKSILVEQHIPGWPQDWFDTGYVVIVELPA